MSDIRFEGWLHRSGTGGVYQDSAGNVGIASTQPQTRLDIGNGGFQVGPTGIATVTTVNTTNLINATQLSHRNLIINGAMNVAQRATTYTGTNNYHTVDRVLTSVGGLDENCTFAQGTIGSSDTGPYEEGFRKSFKITNGNQTSGAGAGDYVQIQSRIEAQNIANSGWNYTSSSSYITLQFWVKSSVAQNFFCYLRTKDGTGQGYPFETGSLSSNTWTKITKTIPGNSNITINDDTGEGFQINISPFWGTDFTGSVSLNAWGAFNGAARTPDHTSTWYTTNDATFEITGLQLELGSVATPFEHRSLTDELQLCKRYFQVIAPSSSDHMIWGWGRAESNSARVAVSVPVPMRAAPTVAASAFRTVKYDSTMIQSTSTPTIFNSSAWISHASTYTVDFPSGGSQSHNNVYIVTSDGGSSLTMDSEL